MYIDQQLEDSTNFELPLLISTCPQPVFILITTVEHTIFFILWLALGLDCASLCQLRSAERRPKEETNAREHSSPGMESW